MSHLRVTVSPLNIWGLLGWRVRTATGLSAQTNIITLGNLVVRVLGQKLGGFWIESHSWKSTNMSLWAFNPMFPLCQSWEINLGFVLSLSTDTGTDQPDQRERWWWFYWSDWKAILYLLTSGMSSLCSLIVHTAAWLCLRSTVSPG